MYSQCYIVRAKTCFSENLKNWSTDLPMTTLPLESSAAQLIIGELTTHVESTTLLNNRYSH